MSAFKTLSSEDKNIYELNGLIPFATPLQVEYIELLKELGSCERVAHSLGKTRRTVERAVKSVREKAAKSGFAPYHDFTHVAPSPHIVKGVSTYYDADGKVKSQWVKTSIEEQQKIDAIKEAVNEALQNPYKLQITEFTEDSYSTDIVPFIEIGDGHFGMIAHESATGQNFNLEIAERELVTAINLAMDNIKPCEKIVIHDVGDGTHVENFKGLTEASGHQMDTDKPLPNMLAIYTKTLRYIVEKALCKAMYVDVIISQGNHSRVNDIWATLWLKAVFEYTERVNVLDNSNVFIPYRIGKTFIMFHHGDKTKPENLAGIMANDFKKDWGETDFHYIDGGHIHQNKVRCELNGAVYESFNQLAANDKYAHDGGWRSRKCLTIVYRSRTWGEVSRQMIPIEKVWHEIQSKQDGAYIPKQRRAVMG